MMIDPRLIDLLDHPDAERRKKAIRHLAKTKDPEVIIHLEDVEATDPDASVREMAGKAALYIKKYAPETQPIADLYGDPVRDYRDDTFNAPEPAEKQYDFGTGGVIYTREQGYYSNYADATPPSNLAPEEKRKVTRRRQTGDPEIRQQQIATLISVMLGILMIGAFVMMPWYEMDFEKLFRDPDDQFIATATGPQAVSGKVQIELANGRILTEEAGATSELRMSLLLVGFNGVVIIIMGLLLLAGRNRIENWFWQMLIVLGLIGMIPFGWTLFELNSDLGVLTRLGDDTLEELGLNPTSLVGAGYWASLAATIGGMVLGFTAMMIFSED